MLAVFLPLVNFLLFCSAGRLCSCRRLSMYAITAMGIIVGALILDLSLVIAGVTRVAMLGTWAASGLFVLGWNFSVDALTYVMLIVVLTVSTLVHLYSTEYMGEDPHLPRFLSYLSLFTFFMLLLITADNFIGLFLGWEGVGLCSYLLISFWFTRVQANKAAIKAMIVNRVSDLAFVVGALTVFYTFQSLDFGAVFGLPSYLTRNTILFWGHLLSPLDFAALLLFVGAMGKSAQIGLHTWLPDAMEGPTPVSALIHAATMVTAGVFLIIRCSFIFEVVPSVLLFITFIGASTAFMAATSGLLQNDLKKVIAYSTCSQLGYMVFACGLSNYELSLFHLANHAFFKALLFLSAGAVIHSISNEQDIRRMGGLARLLPYTHVMFIIGSLALTGFPFLTGFYSKDVILEIAAILPSALGRFSYWLGLITALFTTFYSFRLLQFTFYNRASSPRLHLVYVRELTVKMAFSLAILALGSIFFGYVARDLFIGLGTNFWAGTIYRAPSQADAQLVGEMTLSLTTKLIPTAALIAVVFLVFSFYIRPHQKGFGKLLRRYSVLRVCHRFLSHKWYFDTVYNRLLNHPLLEVSYNVPFGLTDKGVLEIFGPTGLGAITTWLGRFVVRLQTARVQSYGLWMFTYLTFQFMFLGFIVEPGLLLAPFKPLQAKRGKEEKSLPLENPAPSTEAEEAIIAWKLAFLKKLELLIFAEKEKLVREQKTGPEEKTISEQTEASSKTKTRRAKAKKSPSNEGTTSEQLPLTGSLETDTAQAASMQVKDSSKTKRRRAKAQVEPSNENFVREKDFEDLFDGEPKRS